MDKLNEALPKSVREKTKKVIRENRGHISIYVCFFVALLFMYFIFSDGDFSFLLTLSSLISVLSFLIVIYCMESTKSCKGISLQTMISYLILLLARLLSITIHQGYLPSDSSGDFLYQFSEFICLVLSGYVVYLCKVRFNNTYQDEDDILEYKYLVAPCLLLAIFIHPSLNHTFITDVSWVFALYVETICVLPQLLMFQKADKVVPAVAHFTAAQSLAKVLSFVFWLSTYRELNSKGNMLKPYVGHWVIFTQVVQILLVADFVLHYIRCITRGISVELIMSDNV
ncbi:er lumen protein retaining receptor, putative [Theileria equi strain WA]|uniref:Er lumen protein retaining receptor, putative n=1 Tax=Theileria equi strain WA TaxID=1537102 RepID=L1LCA5_THEEQ|nr:er lumen protein retaining receptor, putative [Theileria equi strain WA]EKX72909.1 er lumen protein retaining receptor, putative [Theileria equi strain WA]|eukprot:XP_004832361.1 er lumen protein retaining receptor, putative [Theileria equi strain WA]